MIPSNDATVSLFSVNSATESVRSELRYVYLLQNCVCWSVCQVERKDSSGDSATD